MKINNNVYFIYNDSRDIWDINRCWENRDFRIREMGLRWSDTEVEE